MLAHDSSLPQVHYDLGLLYLYAPSIPGMTAKQQIAEAIRELTKFREIRARDEKDDSEELLNSAKIKEGEIERRERARRPPRRRRPLWLRRPMEARLRRPAAPWHETAALRRPRS